MHANVMGIQMWREAVMWFSDLLLSLFSTGNYEYNLGNSNKKE